jgi:4-carboxymuconolactone decarboxylase
MSLEAHLRRGLDNGLTPEEISEVITHLAFYLGWPASVASAHVAQAVFAGRKKPSGRKKR